MLGGDNGLKNSYMGEHMFEGVEGGKSSAMGASGFKECQMSFSEHLWQDLIENLRKTVVYKFT